MTTPKQSKDVDSSQDKSFTYDKASEFNKASKQSAANQIKTSGGFKTTVMHVFRHPRDKELGLPPLFCYRTEVFGADPELVQFDGIEVKYRVTDLVATDGEVK